MHFDVLCVIRAEAFECYLINNELFFIYLIPHITVLKVMVIRK